MKSPRRWKTFRKLNSPTRAVGVGRKRCCCEQLEGRLLLAVVTVDTLLDEADGSIVDGDISVRDAIELAAEGDTVDFNPALDGGTILLTLGELSVERSLTIDATSLAHGLTIDASGSDLTPNEDNGDGSRIFNIADGDDLDSLRDVTLRGLTLTGGDRPRNGGAISATENVHLLASTIQGNSGGGVHVSYPGELVIISSSILDNVGTGIRGSKVSINDSTVSGTIGFGVRARDVTVVSSTISGNAGSGIYVRDYGSGTIEGSVISGNASAEHGGGIYVESGDGDTRVTVTSSTISGNTASSRGGGIFGQVKLTSSTVADNSAGTDGGGIFGSASVDNSTISGNIAGRNGGGIAGSSRLLNSTVSGNSAGRHGGGIYSSGSLRFGLTTISGNSAGQEGGGIFMSTNYGSDKPTIAVSNSIVAANIDRGHSADIGLGGHGKRGELTATFSLIGDNSGTSLSETPTGTPDANGNLVGSSDGAGILDPLLSPLANNGGPTQTHAPQADSPVIDVGDPDFIPQLGDLEDGEPGTLFDQRDAPFSRAANGRIDMGAHEQQTLTASIVDLPPYADNAVDEIEIQFSDEVIGFNIADVELSRNGSANLLGDGHSLTSIDGRSFLLTGLDSSTTPFGYYTLSVDSRGIMNLDGVPLDSGDTIRWATGRLEPTRIIVDSLLDEADGLVDDGDVALRDAIAAAAPGETIEFDPALTGDTIVLTLGELFVDKSLTIDASGLDNGLALDASGNDATPNLNRGDGSRALTINDGNVFADSNVHLAGLTFRGGNLVNAGGAIFSRERLTILDSTIADNWGHSGGGVFSTRDLELRGSTLTHNISQGAGGAILANGGLTLHDSVVTDSVASATGGGISASGVVELRDSRVSRNSGGDGGGLSATGHLTLIRSMINDNVATGKGGGVFVSDGVHLIDSKVTGNTSRGYGGGIYVDRYGSGSVLIESSTVSRNSTMLYGGGVHFDRGAVTLNFSTVSGNSADRHGGGLIATDVCVTSSTVSGNSAGRSGGGIRGSNVFVTTSTVTDNSAVEDGGGIIGSIVTLLASTVSGNSAGEDAGGIRGDVTSRSSTISENSAGRSGGGMVGDVTATSSTISGNSARIGGGIHSQAVYLENSIVADNRAEVAGSDVALTNDATITARYSLVGDNTGTTLAEAPIGMPDENGNLVGDSNGQGIIDPLLSPLGDYGGRTRTHALLTGSRVIDMGDPNFVAPPELDQRGATFSRVSGGRIDMGAFESQIAPVDFDHDDQLNCADIDKLVSMIVNGTSPPEFDLTGDSFVDQVDVDVWLALAGLENLPSHTAYVPGDANLDGKVDATDLNVVGLNWRQDMTGWCSGDFVADGVVDAKDLNQLGINWQLDVSADKATVANRRVPRAPLVSRAAESTPSASTLVSDLNKRPTKWSEKTAPNNGVWVNKIARRRRSHTYSSYVQARPPLHNGMKVVSQQRLVDEVLKGWNPNNNSGLTRSGGQYTDGGFVVRY